MKLPERYERAGSRSLRAHMAKSMEIPQDIIDSIIAAVGDDRRLLKQCSLVSSSFLLPSRKHLFSRIILRNDKACQGIHQLLVQNPAIQPCVRAITLMDRWIGEFPQWMNSTSLPAIRLLFGCLECFSINLDTVTRVMGNRNFGIEIVLAVNWKMRSRISYIHPNFPQGHHQSTSYFLPPDCPPYDIGVALCLGERFW